MNNKIIYLILGLFVSLALIALLYYDLFCSIIQIENNISKNNKLVLKDSNQSEIDVNQVIVQTLSGSLLGQTLNVSNRKIISFIGVPYAQPPIGDLRFASPEPVKKWTGVRLALKFTPMCPQVLIPNDLLELNLISNNISEDCLNLNIWTPEIKPKTLRTVMVWIHGGGFLYHSANTHELDGQVLASFGDVVVVTINYRVGVFGFLNARTEDAPGNMGIYDQSLALNWVKDNIENFGGDPNKLVPFGQSAGAISIGILMSFNQTKNLFSRAITQSGSFLLPHTSQTYGNSKKFAKLVGCFAEEENNEESDSFAPEVVECLKKANFETLYSVSLKFLDDSYMPFMPSIDSYNEDILPPMDYLIEDNAYTNMKELMTGLVKNEGSFFVYILNPELFKKNSYPELKTLKETREMFINLIKNKTDISEDLLTFVANSYINGPISDSPKKNIERLIEAFGNAVINCPTIFLADELVARNKTVFMYLHDHRPKSSQFGEWLGSYHYSEVPFVFGYPLKRPKKFNNIDIEFSKRIMKSWSHFAKTGKALPQLNLEWPEYNQQKSFMFLNPKNSTIIKEFSADSCILYKTVIQLHG